MGGWCGIVPLMSRDAQHPRGANGPRGAFDIPDSPPVEGARLTEAGPSGGLFDDESDLRSIGGTSFDEATDDPFEVVRAPADRTSALPATGRRDTGRALASPILGSGPEIARGPRREPTGRHELLRQAPFAPTASLPVAHPTALERILEAVHRWRTPLGLGLAAMITVGVVVVYERSTGDETAASDGSGAESRSALASATEFDEAEGAGTDSGDDGDREVNSAVGELEDPADPTGSPTSSASGTTSNDPASPTTATNRPSSEPSATSTPTTPSSADSSPTSGGPTTTPSSNPSSTSDPTTASTAEQPSTTPSTSDSTTPSSNSSTPPFAVRSEAEAATLVGAATTATDRAGFSGAGFVTDLVAVGSGVSFTVTSTGGPTPFVIGYSAGPEDGAPASRSIGILVDGERKTSALMDATPTWDDWTTVGGMLELPAGDAVITIVVEAGDTGQVNIDYIEVGP